MTGKLTTQRTHQSVAWEMTDSDNSHYANGGKKFASFCEGLYITPTPAHNRQFNEGFQLKNSKILRDLGSRIFFRKVTETD